MKIFIISILFIAAVAATLAFTGYRRVSPTRQAELVSATPTSFYELTYTSIDGKMVKMSDYKGKYILFVNVASKCGNTPQYDALQNLYEKHGDKLVIIGFPCNQFGFQESKGEAEIAEFCTKNYGVTFQLSSKVDVKGKDQHPVYTWLTSKTVNGVSDDNIEWNFHKVLVSPSGEWLKSFAASMDPGNGEIEKMLK
jgi:glutathione peroxidase